MGKKHDVRNSAKDAGRGRVRVSGSTVDLIRNPEQIKDWDDEELERGRRRDKNGNFTGNTPNIIPMECFKELNRRRIRRAHEMMSEAVIPAMRELRAIIESPSSDDKDKLAAIKIMLDRGLGTAPSRVDVSVETPPWLAALQGGIVSVDETEDEDIEEAEIIWDSEEEEAS